MPRSEPDSGRRPPPTCSYVHEAVNPPVARAPKLDRALQAARACGEQPLVPDRTLIPIGWPTADRPFHLGKHHCHGMNLQIIATLEAGWRGRRERCPTASIGPALTRGGGLVCVRGGAGRATDFSAWDGVVVSAPGGHLVEGGFQRA